MPHLCKLIPAVDCEVEAVALDDREDAGSKGSKAHAQAEGQEQGVKGTLKGLGVHPKPAAAAFGLLVLCLGLQLSL